MEEDNNVKDEGAIVVLTRATLNGLIKEANRYGIRREKIITIIKGDNQYHLIYSE